MCSLAWRCFFVFVTSSLAIASSVALLPQPQLHTFDDAPVKRAVPLPIVDAFIFNGEDALLELRLKELRGVVQHHLLLQGECDFRGAKSTKKMFAPSTMSSKFPIAHHVVPCDLMPRGDAWNNERFLRNYFTVAFKDIISRAQYFMLSDVDEVPRRSALVKFIESGGLKPSTIYSMAAHFYYYNVDCESPDMWETGPKLFEIASVLGAGGYTLDGVRGSPAANKVPDAAWHFSYFQTKEDIAQKVHSFSHAEFDQRKFTNFGHICERVQACGDLFDRQGKSFCCPQTRSPLPYAMKAHIDDWGAKLNACDGYSHGKGPIFRRSYHGHGLSHLKAALMKLLQRLASSRPHG